MMRATLAVGILALGLAGCASGPENFVSPPGADLRRDYADCRIKARSVSGEYGGLAALAAYNETIDDCMVAKGYNTR